MTLLRALPIRRLSSGEGRVFALVSAARGPKVTQQRPPALFSSRHRTAGTVRAGRSVATDLARVRAAGHTKPRALRAVVPVMAPDATQGDAQRLHAWTSTAHAVELPGHLTASRPSPDASNRRIHDESAHSLMTVRGRRLRSLGETGLARNLTPASHNNGCERFKPVWDSLAKVRPAWACRRKARHHCRSSRAMRSNSCAARAWMRSSQKASAFAAQAFTSRG